MSCQGIFVPLFALFCIKTHVSSFKDCVTNPTKVYYTARINASMEVNQLRHFWRSTGFCPPDPHQDFYKFMSSNDIAQNIVYIGSVPNNGIEQIRIHWLLDLITMSINDDGSMEYSFTNLDKALDLLLSNGLRPGFELMGNPSNYFTDFDDEKQIYAWRDLVKSLGIHFIEKYGLEEVSHWNFESWNEPQNKQHFDGLKVSLQGYLNYYDACSEGLLMVNPLLKFGGPASGNPETHHIFFIITQHQNLLIPTQKMKYSLLSNDNGFMGYPPSFFSQRTLLARFQMNTSHPRKVEFIKKPVLGVMGLLSILGDRQLFTDVSMATGCATTNDDFGVIASTVHSPEPNKWELAVIGYNSNDTTNKTGIAVVNLNLSGIPVVKEAMYVIYKIDNNHGNPYGTWKRMMSPVFPTEKQFQELRLNQEPVRVAGPLPLPSKIHPGNLVFNLELALPGVFLIHFCAKPLSPPSKVSSVSLLAVSTNEVLVSWKHPQARCIKTYQVLYSEESEAGPYEMVNNVDIIFCAYQVTIQKDEDRRSKGWFIVLAVDYWNRIGQQSKPVEWSSPEFINRPYSR